MSIRLSLDVWLDGYGAPAGRLDANDDGSVGLTYSDAFLDHGRSISLSLPFDG